MYIFRQDPNAIVKYTVNWATALDGDTISGTPTWVAPDGPTQSGAGNTTTTHYVKLSGVAANTRYLVTSRIVTAAGLQFDYTFMVIGEER